mgnify:CR=1 FL=1
MTVYINDLIKEREELGAKIVSSTILLCSYEGTHMSEEEYTRLNQQIVAMLTYHQILLSRARRCYTKEEK